MRYSGALLWSLFAGLLVLGLYSLEPSDLARAGTGRSSALNAPLSGSKPLYETFIDHRRREWSELARHGFNPSISKTAYANAMTQRLRMEAIANSGTSNAAAPAVAGTWTFIGPQPMKGQKANFTGDLFGPVFNGSGRVSAIAIDPSGNICGNRWRRSVAEQESRSVVFLDQQGVADAIHRLDWDRRHQHQPAHGVRGYR